MKNFNAKSFFTSKSFIVAASITVAAILIFVFGNAIFGEYIQHPINGFLDAAGKATSAATRVDADGNVINNVINWVHSGDKTMLEAADKAGITISQAPGVDLITGFLGLKSRETFGMLFLMIALMITVWKIGKKTGSFTKMILSGIAAAAVIGVIGGIALNWEGARTYTSGASTWTYWSAGWAKDWYSWAGRFSSTWTSTLQLIVVPTVFFSIVALLIRFGKDKTMKSYFIKGFLYLTVGAGLASAIAFIIGLPFLGAMENLPFAKGTATASANDLNTILGGFFPSNLTAAFSNANSVIVPIILFALAFGGFTVKMSGWGKDYSEAASSIEKFAIGGNKIFNTLLDYTIGLLPLAIVALLSRAIIRFGNVDLLVSLGGYLVYVYAALVSVYVISTLVTAFVTKTNPLRVAKNGLKAVMTGFFTQSSLGTLPVSIKTAKEAGNSEKGSDIVPTMATTMGAWGCAGVYPTAVVMALVAAGAVELNIQLVIMTVIVTMFASIGIAGVPGVAGIAVGIVLAGIGQSEHYALFFALLYPLESLVDMGRTALNVHAGQAVTAIVETENKTMDFKTYRGK